MVHQLVGLGRVVGIVDLDLGHHSAVFVLNDVAVVHEDAGYIEPNLDPHVLARVDDHRVLEAELVDLRGVAVTRQDGEGATVHVVGVDHPRLVVGVFDVPDLNGALVHLVVNPVHLELLAVHRHILVAAIKGHLVHR